MDNLKNISRIVTEILKEDKRARNSDSYLYLAVCQKINPDCINRSFLYVMSQINDLGLPKMESVRRTRQKVQHDHPELAGNRTVTDQRRENEQEFRKFARG